jgi:hypothetical protein
MSFASIRLHLASKVEGNRRPAEIDLSAGAKATGSDLHLAGTSTQRGG